MKNVFRRFLIVCYMLGALSTLFGCGHAIKAAGETVAAFRVISDEEIGMLVFSGLGIWILCFLAHFVFLGILNPLRLFKPMAQ